MKTLSLALALSIVLGFAGLASAAKGDNVKGKITKIDGKTLTISSGKKGEEKDVTVTVDDKTTYTVDGKDAKLEDLKEGQRITVTPATGTATHIEVMAPKKKTT